jgi:hypothetical protein
MSFIRKKLQIYETANPPDAESDAAAVCDAIALIREPDDDDQKKYIVYKATTTSMTKPISDTY